MKPCPHCGKDDYVYTNTRLGGYCKELFDQNGNLVEQNLDTINWHHSKTYRCCSCNKIRRDIGGTK